MVLVMHYLILASSWFGEQAPSEGYWRKTIGLLTDPPHATVELFYSGVEQAIIFVIAIFFGKRALRREHARLDKEHGYHHDDDGSVRKDS